MKTIAAILIPNLIVLGLCLAGLNPGPVGGGLIGFFGTLTLLLAL